MIDVRCPRIGCDGEVKDNGWGNHRCRKCDVEFSISYDPQCKHKLEEHEHCVHCKHQQMKGDPNHQFG